jgi:hypothetical protein
MTVVTTGRVDRVVALMIQCSNEQDARDLEAALNFALVEGDMRLTWSDREQIAFVEGIPKTEPKQ